MFFSHFKIFKGKLDSRYIEEIFSDFFSNTDLVYDNVESIMNCFYDLYDSMCGIVKDDYTYILKNISKKSSFEIIKEVLTQFTTLDFLKLKDNKIFFKLSDISDNERNYNNLKGYLNLLKIYNLENTFEINASGSKGENAFIHNLAFIDTILNELKENITEDKIVYLCIDEIEQNLHPEWCRLLYSKISKLISNSNINNKFYLYMSTHSPYVISDFTRIILLI